MDLDAAKKQAQELLPITRPSRQPVGFTKPGRREGTGQGFFEQLAAMTPGGFPFPGLILFAFTELLGLTPYGPEEKLRWGLDFEFRGAIFAFELRKFGLRFLVEEACRTNRTYGSKKTHGLIVDYLGVFDDVAKSLEFDEKGFRSVVDNIEGLKEKLPEAMQKCLAFFPGVDRTQTGYEGLMAAQECLPNNDVRDAFAGEYSVLGKIWEAVSPDPLLAPYEKDYRWLSQVYTSVQPTSGTGRPIWHALGAKTIELIHENVHVDAVHDDLETLVVDAGVLEAIMGSPDANKGTKIMVLLTCSWVHGERDEVGAHRELMVAPCSTPSSLSASLRPAARAPFGRARPRLRATRFAVRGRWAEGCLRRGLRARG